MSSGFIPVVFLKNVLGVEILHQVDEAHLPAPCLRANDGIERQRRSAMSAAGVEINQIDCRHGARRPDSPCIMAVARA